MAPTFSQPAEQGRLAPPFSLPGVDGRTWQLQDFTFSPSFFSTPSSAPSATSFSRALVVAFICNHCPYVVAIQERMVQLAAKVAAQGVAWVAINSNDSQRFPEDSFAAMKERAHSQGYSFPYLWDESQAVARAYGAACTPEFFLFQKESSTLAPQDDTAAVEWRQFYQGRLDDCWQDPQKVQQKDLEWAMEDLLAARPLGRPQVPAMGCSVKWK